MRIVNGKKYQLVEFDSSLSDKNSCSECALVDYCDMIADNLNDIEYMICAEDEDDLENFENPIYKEIDYDQEDSIR